MSKVLVKSERGEGCVIYPYYTHRSKNREKARQKQPITLIIRKLLAVILTACTFKNGFKDFYLKWTVKNILEILNPSAIGLLPILIPGLGEVLDYFDVTLYSAAAIGWFRKFCGSMLASEGN